jgi:ethanolamine utilization protein EutA (predicted chaperonin)
VVLYVQISQFDANTGPCEFRGWFDSRRHEYNFEYPDDNGLFYAANQSDCPEFDRFSSDSTVKVWATVIGAESYDTTIGGSTTATSFRVVQIQAA